MHGQLMPRLAAMDEIREFEEDESEALMLPAGMKLYFSLLRSAPWKWKRSREETFKDRSMGMLSHPRGALAWYVGATACRHPWIQTKRLSREQLPSRTILADGGRPGEVTSTLRNTNKKGERAACRRCCSKKTVSYEHEVGTLKSGNKSLTSDARGRGRLPRFLLMRLPWTTRRVIT